MPATIPTTFTRQDDLPAWAQGSRAIVYFARRDLAFRIEVQRAETEQMRAFVRREAERRMEALENS